MLRRRQPRSHSGEPAAAAPADPRQRHGSSSARSLGGWSGTARRLLFGFGALILLFAAASYAALAGLGEIRRGLERIKDHEEGVRLALELASAVRDQYAHQAHTIILGNLTHLGFYAQAAAHVRDLTGAVRAHTAEPAARALVDDIEAKSRDLDAIFGQRIVPAVLAGERASVQTEHARAQEIVSLIQSDADRLAGRFEAAIQAFRAEVSALEAATFRWTLFFLVGAPLVAAVITIYIGRSIARPMALLGQGAARLGRGDLTMRIEIDRPDEFGALARQFNAMTAALQEHQEKLVQTEKLAGIGRLAAGVAHEINNPLGVILGYARVLKKSAAGPLAADLRVIEEEALRAQEIVEGLLDLSRPVRTAADPVDLREICEEVRQRLVETGAVADVLVAIDGQVSARGHAPKLRQVIWNLMKNALEAAGAGGRVAVHLRPCEGEAEVAVSDTGPGIDPAVRERLFEPFLTTKPTGTGLGLAVSRAIARAHGGDVELAGGPGAGARFRLRLPLAGPAGGAAEER